MVLIKGADYPTDILINRNVVLSGIIAAKEKPFVKGSEISSKNCSNSKEKTHKTKQ